MSNAEPFTRRIKREITYRRYALAVTFVLLQQLVAATIYSVYGSYADKNGALYFGGKGIVYFDFYWVQYWYLWSRWDAGGAFAQSWPWMQAIGVAVAGIVVYELRRRL